MTKRALITGITGQDGSYLAELLIKKGYEVYGIARRSSSFNRERLRSIYDYAHEKTGRLVLEYGDMTDSSSILRILQKVKPHEIYHLAAQSHVKISFEIPEYTANGDALGTLRMLEAIKNLGMVKDVRFYNASTSELYGKAEEIPQTENTPFHPRSPYAIAKLYAHWITANYREAYGLFACNGILFNHESERRGENFVSKKITQQVAKIKLGIEKELVLGNLNAKRDWGYASEYCINKDVPILTTDGWMFCDDVIEGQEIINFDTKRNRLTRDKVIKKFILESRGNKIILEGGGVYLRVTPEHRIYYQFKSKNSKGGWSKWKVKTAEEFYNMLKDKSYRTKYDYRLPHFQDYDAEDYKEVSYEQLYLMGVLLAEGCIHKSQRQNDGVEISISQSYIANEPIFKKIQNTIDQLGLKYRINEKNDGCVEWRFNSENSKKILEWFDVLNIHIMPRYFYKLSRKQAETVFSALMDCDGNWGSMTFVSKRYLLATDFQTIAHLAGYRTSGVKKRKLTNCYDVTVIVQRKKHTYVQKAEKINDGCIEVWCVKTNNGTIITRDNCCISISGNCEAMWLMLQQDKPEDFVISTGKNHTVREFVEKSFKIVGIDLSWKGEGVNEKGINSKTKDVLVRVDPRYFRPAEVDELLGDSSYARKKLGWKSKTSFDELVKIMVDYDLDRFSKNPNAHL